MKPIEWRWIPGEATMRIRWPGRGRLWYHWSQRGRQGRLLTERLSPKVRRVRRALQEVRRDPFTRIPPFRAIVIKEDFLNQMKYIFVNGLTIISWAENSHWLSGIDIAHCLMSFTPVRLNGTFEIVLSVFLWLDSLFKLYVSNLYLLHFILLTLTFVLCALYFLYLAFHVLCFSIRGGEPNMNLRTPGEFWCHSNI